MDSIAIRHAVPEDVPALIAFWAQAGENGSRPADRPEAVLHLIERDQEALIGAERCCAMVLDKNESGQALWKALGYTQQDDWSRWIKPSLTLTDGRG